MFLLIHMLWNNKLFSISKTGFQSIFASQPIPCICGSIFTFLPPRHPPCSDTFCLAPNKDVTLRCRERPPMLNAVLSCTDLSQFVSLRTTVSSFHSASRRWLRYLPSPKYTFHVHTWQEEREVVTKASVVILKYDHLERRKKSKKSSTKTPLTKSCPSYNVHRGKYRWKHGSPP